MVQRRADASTRQPRRAAPGIAVATLMFDECAPPGGTTSAGRGLCTDHNVDPNTGAPYPVHRVASYTAFDIYAGYALKTSLGTTSFSAGVRNVFNVSPPVVYESFLTFADPSYDFIGRYFWGRIVHKF